jgi:cytochrome P450
MLAVREIHDAPLLSGSGLLGHARMIREDRLDFLQRIIDDGREVLRFRVFSVEALVANSPEIYHQVLTERAKDFDKTAVLRYLLYPLAGEGLFTSRSELWRRQRRLMSPLFHHSQLVEYASSMVECTERAMSTWRDGEALDVARETTRITMSVAGRTLFDADTFTEADELGEALTIALSWASQGAASVLPIVQAKLKRRLDNLGPRLPPHLREPYERRTDALHGPLLLFGAKNRELRRAVKTLDSRVQRMIDERRRAGFGRADLLTKLLATRDDDGSTMSDKQVRDEVLTLFVAGHETTATGLAWSLYLLGRHPDWYRRVQAEVDALGRTPRFEDLPRLPLCLAVFKEALRLYPPVYIFSREAVRETEVGGYRIPRGRIVFLTPYALHRHRVHWPDAERFDPERFTPEREALRTRHSYLPFSGGPRVCIGNHFALMEGQLVLATLLGKARFQLVGAERVVPEPSATLRPRGGVPMRVSFRSAPLEARPELTSP